MIDGEDENGLPRRGKNGRYLPGSTGNPRGRPSKRRRLMVPNQILRDVTVIADQEITVDSPSGPRTITKGEFLLERVYALAAKGNPTAINRWMAWWTKALEERMQRHPSIELAELFRKMYEDPTGDHEPAYLAAMDVWKKRLKRL